MFTHIYKVYTALYISGEQIFVTKVNIYTQGYTLKIFYDKIARLESN